VAAVRAVLDALAVPAARQALLLEQALAAQMAVFTGAPAAADFDPLARSAVAVSPRAARPPPAAAARRKAAAAKQGEPGAGLGVAGIGAAAAAVLQAAAQQPPQAQSISTGIAAAVAGLTAPEAALPRRPAPPTPERAVRSATLGALGAVAQTAHVAAKALDAVPGAGVTAPVLERIAEIGGALWLQVALSPPGQAGSSSASADSGVSTRGARPAPRVADGAARGVGASSSQRPAAAVGAASHEATSPVEVVTDALAGIGRLTVELFGAAARAGAPDLLGTTARPAPRAPNVLTPDRATEPTSRPSDVPPSTTTPGVAIDIDTDALARALRAEADLRGVAL
jgi:hypothetical protein